jgi:hypothetical protein
MRLVGRVHQLADKLVEAVLGLRSGLQQAPAFEGDRATFEIDRRKGGWVFVRRAD